MQGMKPRVAQRAKNAGMKANPKDRQHENNMQEGVRLTTELLRDNLHLNNPDDDDMEE